MTRRLNTKRFLVISGALTVLGSVLLWTITALQTQSVSASFQSLASQAQSMQVQDRYGTPLRVSYQSQWNTHDKLPLHKIPEFLQQAFIFSEDKRFYQHDGIDWLARLHALAQNLKAFKAVRGASTLPEQVVRIIHPRPRTVWSRWLEGWEARELEQHVSKSDILELYLNQVPYASHRRGVAQAAHHYFNRDLDTLTTKEMLALVVLVRAPSRFDLYRNPKEIESAILRLAESMTDSGIITPNSFNQIQSEQFQLEPPSLRVEAPHFVNHVTHNLPLELEHGNRKIRTTLDGSLQNTVQTLLDQRLAQLQSRLVHHGAVLVVDHSTGDVLVWAVAGGQDPNRPGSFIDAVTTLRQPGSSLKPFLYTLALENGWTAATLIHDSPLAESVGTGLHHYRNYSRTFYGPVTLRNALGNSLNIPAVRAAKFVGVDHYLHFLRRVGFDSVDQHPGFYGDGLALGNGEVTLLEMVQAYTVLANGGVLSPLRLTMDNTAPRESRRVVSGEVTSLIAHILSDPGARQLEFGSGSVLNLPVQTAVKTGTSSDYRDAWAMGFNHRYTVGVWMGNLDQRPTKQITGSTGPALLLRSVFAELNRNTETQPLDLNPALIKQDICRRPNGEGKDCLRRSEWFVPGTEPNGEPLPEDNIAELKWIQPFYGLRMAMDPRIPDELEAFEFQIQGVDDNDKVKWKLNGEPLAQSQGGKYMWNLKKGRQHLQASIYKTDLPSPQTLQVVFFVK